MIVDDYIFYFNSASRFHSHLRISGIFHEKSGRPIKIKKLAFATEKPIKTVAQCNEENNTLVYHFSLEALIEGPGIPESLAAVFTFDKKTIKINLVDIFIDANNTQNDIHEKFIKIIDKIKKPRLLDIGGRARSGLLRSKLFNNCETTVIDIIKDDGVDVAIDAHIMSSALPNNFFDACISVSVFEHLIMPWKVALEMNKVLKKGGIAMISTHQTIGMHDIPWDYFRYSDNAWDGIFNPKTGFKILERKLSNPNYIIPFFWSDRHLNAELAAGYELSAVLVEKVAETELLWPLAANDLVSTPYPT